MRNVFFFDIGAVGQAPREVKIITSDDFDTVTTEGWLTQNGLTPDQLLPTDYIALSYGVSSTNPGGTFGFYIPSFGANNAITLVPQANASEVTYTAPSVANYLAKFSNTTGNLTTAPGDVTNLGGINAGTPGTLGYLRIYPGTNARGWLNISATNNVSNYAFNITNAAVGQDTDLTIADPVNATGVIPTTVGLTTGNLVKGGAGSILVDAGAAIHGGTDTWGGGGTSHQFTTTGTVAGSIVTVSLRAQAGTAYIVSYVVGTDTTTVTFSADPGAGTIINWTSLTAAI